MPAAARTVVVHSSAFWDELKHDYRHYSNILENNPVLTTHQVSTSPCRLGTMYFCMTLKDLDMINARENKKYNMNDPSPSSRLDWRQSQHPTITDPRFEALTMRVSVWQLAQRTVLNSKKELF
jgi:hypothetical protein